MMEPSRKIDTFVVASDLVEVDERGKDISVEGTHDYNAHLHLLDVDKAVVDQSGSRIHAKGERGKACFVNTFEGCDDVEVNQNGSHCVAEASEDSKYTAVNYVEGVKDYKQTMKDSVIVVDSRKRKSKSGITAHTIIGEGTNATITVKNTNIIIRS